MFVADLRYVGTGLLDGLGDLLASWVQAWRFGLFQNDLTPDLSTVLAQIVPATFSGYAGLLTAAGWTAPALEGNRAVSRPGPLSWTHDGGAVANWIYGYYVQTLAGALVLAQRVPNAPAYVGTLGRVVSVAPVLSLRTEQ